MLCDSNILIYAADPEDTRCRAIVEREDAAIAGISRIEVLGFPGFGNLSADRQTRLQAMVASLVELPLDERVILRAIALRQQEKMSLGDAVIAATALVYDLALVTRNVDDFKHIAAYTRYSFRLIRLSGPGRVHRSGGWGSSCRAGRWAGWGGWGKRSRGRGWPRRQVCG